LTILRVFTPHHAIHYQLFRVVIANEVRNYGQGGFL
jgi:hypothetical protein